MNREIRIFEDAAALAKEAATVFARLATESARRKDLFSVVLSGGSTPKSLYSLLATEEPWRSELPWTRIHFFWGDERNVPPDHAESNYRMAYETMLAKVPVPGENIYRIKSETDPSKGAQEYEREIEGFFHLTAGQLPRFDLVLLGLGQDGHVASLFPETAALQEREHLVVANWVERLKTWRITLTLPVLNKAANVIFLVSGTDKANILRAVLEDAPAEHYPAQLIRPIGGSLLWLVDREAASLLRSTVQDAR